MLIESGNNNMLNHNCGVQKYGSKNRISSHEILLPSMFQLFQLKHNKIEF